MLKQERKIFFHVMYSRKDGAWHIKEGDGDTITSFASKDEAINKATELAQNTKAYTQRHIIIHKTNGVHESVKEVNEQPR